MHVPRARFPHKRTRSGKSGRDSASNSAARAVAVTAPDPTVVNLAAHRSAWRRQPAPPPRNEVYGLVEWIGPAREDWRRGEMGVYRSACVPMTVSRLADGAVELGDLPGKNTASRIELAALEALACDMLPALVLTLPGMRVTLTSEDLLSALPARPAPARILAFPLRRAG